MIPYIDIHTHNQCLSVANCWVVTNFLQTDFDKIGKKDGDTEGGKMVSVGLHPYYLTKENANFDVEKLAELIDNQQVVAIGECGLDRLRGEDLAFQRIVFERQIRLAEAVQKPVVVHCVRAFNELIAVKKRLRPSVPLIVHGFVKNEQILRELLEHDFYVSIGAAILRGGDAFKNTVKMIPNNRLFLETDDASDAIETIYEAVAEARGMSVKDLQSTVYENFQACFHTTIQGLKEP